MNKSEAILFLNDLKSNSLLSSKYKKQNKNIVYKTIDKKEVLFMEKIMQFILMEDALKILEVMEDMG